MVMKTIEKRRNISLAGDLFGKRKNTKKLPGKRTEK
jgi:hypothetical protein